ncbi:hypothetical protein [uncultured Marinobacter sp.]|uniref:hypothetical protein n=1 Tax=uncultured Marinobacter sp. TaxID=187379 RepID=UPI002585F6A9|nr:hypothetical protein [uncultured Marinobacter sp.]
MSKRFGRNQKRKMREQLAACRAQNRQLQALMQRNKRIVEDTAEVLGNHFLTLDPYCIEVRTLDSVLPNWRVPIMDSNSHFMGAQGVPEMATFMEHVLPVLRGGSFQDLQGRQHFRFTVSGHAAGYAIDLTALRQAPDRIGTRYLTIEIAEQLAYHMMKSINNRPELDNVRI